MLRMSTMKDKPIREIKENKVREAKKRKRQKMTNKVRVK